VHAFRNESGEPALMLILFAPGALREAYFESLAEIGASGRRPSADPEDMGGKDIAAGSSTQRRSRSRRRPAQARHSRQSLLILH
jgi:hypothetical protein